jgi:O-antigen/teichoic acid export membrane protein
MSVAAVITRNVMSNWVGLTIEAVVGFLLAPFIVRSVGDTAYGIWALVLAFSGYFGLLNFGLRPAINKYVAQYRQLGDYTAMNAVVNAALTFYAVVGALVLVMSVGLSRVPTAVFQIPSGYATEARIVTILVGIQVALALPGVVIGGILSGLQRYDLHSVIGGSLTLLRAALVVVFLAQYPSIRTLAIVNILTTAGGLALTILAVLRVCPQIHFRLTLPRGEIVRLLCRYSGTAVVIQLAARLVYYADSLVIAYFLPVAAVTPFVIGGKLAELSRDLIMDTTSVLSPAASQLQAARQERPLQAMLEYSTKMLLLLIIPLGLGFILLGRPFIVLWMGPQYALSADILAVLAVGQLFSLPQQGLRSMLYGMGEHRFMAYTTAVEGCLNLVLSIILVQHYGILGVAWGTTIPAIVVAIFGLPRIGCRLLGLCVWAHVRRSYLSPVCTSVVFVGCVLLAVRWIPPVTWVALAAVAVGSSLVYLGVALAVSLEPAERAKALAMLRDALGLRRAPFPAAS